MNEQGYEQTPEQAEDRKRTEAEEADDEGIDEDIEQIIKAAGQLPEDVNPMDLIMEGIRPVLREMATEERRRFCADMATCGSPSNNNNKTGRYFNGFKSARGLAEPDYKELGRKIMEKRNPHYRPDNQ
ncbi:MAG: hypothetical protein IJQ71_08200 [Clostridia bacterium]|nr:hypothetical protein [Clostridia bacterium]